MPYSINEDSRGVVVVVHTGALDLAIANSSREEAGRMMHERGLKRVLVDCDQTTFHPSTLDLMEFNKTHHDHFPPGSRMAVVVNVPPELRPDTEFAETVAQNRGFLMKLFSGRDEALAWLIDDA